MKYLRVVTDDGNKSDYEAEFVPRIGERIVLTYGTGAEPVKQHYFRVLDVMYDLAMSKDQAAILVTEEQAPNYWPAKPLASKQQQFLWIVQTMVLANAVNLSSGSKKRADEYRTEISASGVFITMDEAVRASELIPDDLTAAGAANEFCSFNLKNLRDAEEKASENPNFATWFAR